MAERAAVITGSGRLAKVLLGLFVIEFGAYAWNIAGLMSDGQSFGQAVARMAMIWIGIRVVAVAYNFALTGLKRSTPPPDEQIGPLAAVRCYLGELAATLVVYTILFPFERLLVPFAPRGGAAGTPIVLVPGFCCNRGYWGRFRRFLEAHGHGPVYAVSLEPLVGDIDDSARHLALAVERVCEETGAEKVILIGHSMGGLTARSLLHNLDGGHRIQKIISLGAPHHGTVLAHGVAPLALNAKQMSLNSDWLAALNSHEQHAAAVPITSIITPHDDIVGPQDSARLAEPYARTVSLPGIGHLEMVLSRPVMEAVHAELQR